LKEKYLVAVTSGFQERFKYFVKSFKETIDISELRLLVLINDDPNPYLGIIGDQIPVFTVHSFGKSPKWGNELEHERIRVVAPYCDEETIYMNFDDDYAVNPYWFKFLKDIFEKYDKVNYLTLIDWKAEEFPNNVSKGPEKLGSYTFNRIKVHMWGSFFARWRELYPNLLGFFEHRDLSKQEFDVDFCHWFHNTCYKGDPQIYQLKNLSLLQHCNFGSTVVRRRGSAFAHAYGDGFDPYCDPFYLSELNRSIVG